MEQGILKEGINISDKKIQDGLDFLLKTDLNNIEDGKHILSSDMYVNIQTYKTKNDADFEAHREYVDIQYIISGEEIIEVTNYNNCKTTIPYNKEKDIEFLKGNGTPHKIEEGEFMVLYPEDAHKPSISIDKGAPKTVRKAVVKVKL